MQAIKQKQVQDSNLKGVFALLAILCIFAPYSLIFGFILALVPRFKDDIINWTMFKISLIFTAVGLVLGWMFTEGALFSALMGWRGGNLFDILLNLPFGKIGFMRTLCGALIWTPLATLLLMKNEMKNTSDLLARQQKERVKDWNNYNWKYFKKWVANNFQAVGGVPLGEFTYQKAAAVIPEKALRQHVCLVGTTGSGKTVTLYSFIAAALAKNKSLIFIDAKGDKGNIAKFKRYCADTGTGKKPKIITIDGKYEKYNPFAVGTVSETTDKIISMTDWTEDYYRTTATSYIQTILQLMQLDGVTWSYPSITDYMYGNYKAQESNGGGFGGGFGGNLADVPNGVERSRLLQKLGSFKEQDVAGIRNRLDILGGGDMGALFSDEGVCLADEMKNGGAVLISLDSLRYSETSRQIGRLIVNDIKAAISHHGDTGQQQRVAFIIDEFNVLAGNEIIDIINKGRSFGIECLLSFQSLADIDKLQGGQDLRRQIIQNCNTLIVQKQNDPKDADELAKVFGTKDAIETTYQADNAGTMTGLGTVKSVKEFIVSPDEIKNLTVGRAFVKTEEWHGRVMIFDMDKVIQ